MSTLNYLPHEDEVGIVTAKVPQYANKNDTDQVAAMVRMADLTRKRVHGWRSVHCDVTADSYHMG